jgi:Putative restriction endonuclease
MNTFVVDRESVSIPTWVSDHDSFRRWLHSEDFPQEGRICFLYGETWVDMSKEQAFSHNQAKNEYSYVLTGISKRRGGTYCPDGMFLSNVEVRLSARPDGMYASDEAFDDGRVRWIAGEDEGYVELEGSPEMVMEIVSTSSVKKDKVTLPPLYWRAGIFEYWLVDVRDERLDFDIFRRGPRGFVPTRKQAGWLRSSVFDLSFRLVKKLDKRGNPLFALLVR